MKDIWHLIAQIEDDLEAGHVERAQEGLEDFKEVFAGLEEEVEGIADELAAQEAEKERAIADCILLRTALLGIIKDTNEENVGGRATQALYETKVYKGEKILNDIMDALYDRDETLSSMAKSLKDLRAGRKEMEEEFGWLL